MKKIKEEKSSKGPLCETIGLNHIESNSKPYSDNRASVEIGMFTQGSQGMSSGHRAQSLCGPVVWKASPCYTSEKSMTDCMWMFAANLFISQTWLEERRY